MVKVVKKSKVKVKMINVESLKKKHQSCKTIDGQTIHGESY